MSVYLFWCLCGLLLQGVTQGFLFGEENSDSLPRPAIAQTTCGPVQGQFDGNGFGYRGIPYAVPPVGTRRWQPPEPLSRENGTCWTGTYNASRLRNACVQLLDKVVGSEDCLFLNVWSPTNSTSANLPVMVYIHGGSLLTGNSDWPGFSANEKLARDTNIVYVSLNYRLQAFGFMALDILTQNSRFNTSGNYGFMDQIRALKWVRDNIRNFGGDPKKVTVYGHSAGGTSVMALTASPLAKGTFQKAIMMSASPLLYKTLAEASADNLVFLKNTNCSTLTCLQQLSAEEVTQAVPWNVFPFWGMTDLVDVPVKGKLDGGLAIIDGLVLKESPFDSWVNGRSIDVPLIIGTAAQETDYYFYPKEFTDESMYTDYVLRKLGTFGTDIAKMALKLYPTGEKSVREQFTSMVSDARVGCGNDVTALWAAVNTNSSVYRYVTTSRPSVPVWPWGFQTNASLSFSGWDAFAFYGLMPYPIDYPSTSDVMFTANIRREFLSFVETGSPYSKDWLPYPENIALMSSQTTAAAGYHSQQCNFWMQNGFFNYSWVN